MSKQSTAIRYREVAAPAILSKYVLCFWQFSVDSIGAEPYEHHVPPDGCTSITIRHSRDGSAPLVILFGPRMETFQVGIDEPVDYFGCRFQPQAGGAFFKQTGSFLNVSEPASFRLPVFTQQLLDALPASPQATGVLQALESVVTRRLDYAQPTDPVVEQAVEQIVASRGGGSISEMAQRLELSPRQLQRRFRAATGLTPKQFARIRRFREAAAELLATSPRPWIHVAYDAGFSDQAHLVREFSQLIGLSGEELRKRHEVIEHEDVNP